jgi:dTMP kinase
MIQFVTFEGGDGTGKTTQVNAAESYLLRRSQACLATREPGGTALGKLIRKVLLEVGESEIAASTELFLYLADRAQHVKQVVAPALTEGKIVLCDRFTDSTLAYQGYGRGIDLAWLRRLNDTASGGLRPHLTLLLDCPVETGLARAAGRRDQAGEASEDRFEREELEFHQRVRSGFLEMARGEPERFRVVDASRSVSETAEQIREIMSRELA